MSCQSPVYTAALARRSWISLVRRSGPAGVRMTGIALTPAAARGQLCTRGSTAWREMACTAVRGSASVSAIATSSMVRPVPSTATGLPSAAASSAPGSHGSAM